MSFSADTDYWSFADTHVLLVSSTQDKSTSEAQAMDENADVSASSIYDTITTRTVEYVSCSDTALLFYDTTSSKDFRIGKVISSHVITGITVTTSNTARPRITITGESCPSADGDVRKIATRDLEIAGSRAATKFGATVDTVTKLNGSSCTVSGPVTREAGTTGSTACADVHTGRTEASNDFVGVTGNPGAAVDTGWTVNSPVSRSDENTGYSTGSIGVFKNVASTAS